MKNPTNLLSEENLILYDSMSIILLIIKPNFIFYNCLFKIDINI